MVVPDIKFTCQVYFFRSTYISVDMEELKETRVRTAPPVGKSLLSKLLLLKDLSWLGISTVYYILMAAMRKLIPRPQKDLTDKVILVSKG